MNLQDLASLTQPARLGDLVCAFAMDARPTPKGRPRFGNGRTYTDAKTVAFEARVRAASQQAMKGKPPTTSEVRVIALFEQTDRRRSDTDNLVKSLMDGMQGAAYANDSQVAEIRARRARGAERDRITVLVEEVPE